jgi:hypothetical protein
MQATPILTDGQPNVHQAWIAQAPELARWAMARLVNRTDARGAYRPLADRGKPYTKPDGTEGRLRALYTSKRGLDFFHE